METVTSCWG